MRWGVQGRMTREATWEMELKGDLTKQRRVEAVDKLLSVMTLLVASIFGLQAVGLDGVPPPPPPPFNINLLLTAGP